MTLASHHTPLPSSTSRTYNHRPLIKLKIGPINKLVWLCLWIVLIPQLIPAFSGVLSSVRLLPLVGLGGTLGAIILMPRIFRTLTVYWPLIFLAVSLFSTVLNRLVGNSWEFSFNYVYLIASGIFIYLMVLVSVSTRRRFICFSVLLVIASAVTTGFLVWENIGIGYRVESLANDIQDVEVAGGLLENQNWLAPLILSAMGVCFALFEIYQKRWMGRGSIIISACLYLSAFFTGSRGTVAAASVLVGLWLFTIHSKRKMGRVFVVLLVIAALYGIRDFAIVSYTFDRISRSDQEEVVRETRYGIIVESLQIWHENVLVGVGLGGVFGVTRHAAHMAFTGLLAETGAAGFLCFYVPLSAVIIRGFRRNRSIDPEKSEQQRVLRILAMGLFAFLFHGLFNETYFLKPFYIQLGLVTALLHVVWQRSVPSQRSIARS